MTIVPPHADNAIPAALLAELYSGSRPLIHRDESGAWSAEPPPHVAGLVSGSFNPLHAGHETLRRVAGRILAGSVHFELPILNADKPPLQPADIERRLEQFSNVAVIVSRAATFVEKAELFAGAAFVVGVDTAERIVQRRFYGDSDSAMHAALAKIRDAGCRFLVAGRQIAGRFQTVADVAIPPAFADLFEEIPPEEFRTDVSSSNLRGS